MSEDFLVNPDQASVSVSPELQHQSTRGSAKKGGVSAGWASRTYLDESASRLSFFELQTLLYRMGVLIPLDVVRSLNAQAIKSSGGPPVDDSLTVSTKELAEYLRKLIGPSGTGGPLNTLGHLARDAYFWLTPIGYFVAGAMLIILSFSSPGFIPANHRANMYLVVSAVYNLNSLKFLIDFPKNEWNAQKYSSDQIQVFKANIELEAEFYDQMNKINSLGGDGSKFTRTFKALSKKDNQLLVYIDKVMFKERSELRLNKRDIEHYILKELGEACTSRVVNDIFKIIDQSNDGAISPEGLSSFLCKKYANRPGWKRNLERGYSVFWITMLSLGWWMSAFFFLGSFLSFLGNILARFDKAPTTILDQKPAVVYALLFFVGCGAFAKISYERLRDSFDRQERARETLEMSLRFASHFQKDDELWVKFKQDGYFNKESFEKLLLRGSVVLTESEVEKVFNDIDKSGKGTITKLEMYSYLAREKPRAMSIFWMCCRSFDFQANFAWVLGSVGYLVAAYATDPLKVSVGSKIGAVGYFVGGVAFFFLAYKIKESYIADVAKLLTVLSIYKKDSRNLHRSLARFSIALVGNNSDTDIESDKIDEEVLYKSSRSASAHVTIPTFEDVLPNRLSNDVKWHVTAYAPSLLYEYIDEYDLVKYIGVLYPFPDKMMSSNFSGVRLSTGGDKVYIENPWYMEYDRVASKLRKEIEVELPMQCTRLVGRPKLIMAQSESKDRLFIHVKVEVKASEDDEMEC